MKKRTRLFVSILLATFIVGTLSSYASFTFKGSKATQAIENLDPSDAEDCADSSDEADTEVEIEDDLDETKEISECYSLAFQKSQLLLMGQQQHRFEEFHRTIITPPPRG